MTIALSMVLLREAADLGVPRIEHELRTRYPELEATLTAAEGGTASWRVRDSDLVLGLMSGPMPWSGLEGPCATSQLWKNASEEVKEHRAHLVVSLSTGLNEIDRSILLTQATAAVLAGCDQAMGVYWGNARLLVPKQIFIEFAEKILPKGPPLDIWVDFRIGWQTKQTSAAFTTGMEALGHMELEAGDWPEKPSELRDRLQELARYLLENGRVIKDGDTIGEDASEKIRVVYAPSNHGHEGLVMQLRYESLPAKPWWKLW